MFGEFLRQRRLDAGLTRKQLAERASVSTSLIEKVELGTRSTTVHTLQALLDQLDVPPVYRRHILELSLPEAFGRDPRSVTVPTAHDLADLASIDHPASFYRMPTYTIVSVNAAYQRTFPGIDAGGNFVEWMFLEPIARTVVVEWRQEALRLVHALRMFSPITVSDPGIERVIANCRKSQEWEELWNDNSSEPAGGEHLLVRDWTNGQVQRLGVRLYNPEFPSRPWWLLRLVPLHNSAECGWATHRTGVGPTGGRK